MGFSVRPLCERHARGQTGVFGIGGDGRDRLSRAQHLYLGARLIEHRRHQHGHAPGANRRVHARLLRDALQAEFVHPVHMHFAGFRVVRALARRSRDQHVVGRDVEHRPDMQLGSGQRAFTERQDSRAALVGDPDELSAGAPARHSGEKIKPSWIFVRVHHPSRPGIRVHGQEQLAALVPRLHQKQRRTRR